MFASAIKFAVVDEIGRWDRSDKSNEGRLRRNRA